MRSSLIGSVLVAGLLVSQAGVAAPRLQILAAPRAAPACTPTWTTIDNFLPSGAVAASASTVVALPFGQSVAAIVAGSTFTSGTTGSWVVRDGVSNSSGTFFFVDDNQAPGAGIIGHPDAIARDGTGEVFIAGGNNAPGSNSGPWVTRASKNGISNWTTVDTFEVASIPAAIAHGAVIDAAGHALVGGTEAQVDGNYHWVVRESGNEGVTWSVSDDQGPVLFSTGVEALAVNSTSGDVYAAGYDFDGSSYTWKVRKRSGSTWSTVDTFLRDPTHASAQGSFPFSATVTASGVVIVVGIAADTNSVNHWTVRRSGNNGATWVTADDFGAGAGFTHCHPRGVATDAGALFVSGECFDGLHYHWLTRVSHDDGVTWATEDNFQLAVGRDSSAGAVSSASGVAYVVGSGRDASGTERWLVRKRTCQ